MKDSIAKKQLREFGILVGFVFPILIGWILPSITGHGFRTWTLWVSSPSLILGLTAPHLLHYPYKAWMALGHILGWINSRIILGLVFIFVLQPIAIIMRLFSYDPLRKKKGNQKSYRETIKEKSINLTRIF